MTDTRESWLMQVVEYYRPWFAKVEKPLPDVVRISTGWSKRPSKNAIATCWEGKASTDGTNHIFIYPTIADSLTVAHTVLHELIHAADDCQSGHKGEFKRVALALGLTGKMTATVPGDELKDDLEKMLEALGEYPHATLSDGTGGKTGAPKQSTRMIKLVAGCCGYTVRTTRKWLDQGTPSCPCGTEMEEEVK